MKRTSVSHVLKVEENVPLVPGDDRALAQVFNNLISNAVRAMEDTGGGVLSVRIKRIQKTSGAPGVQVDVLDTGPGIPPEVRDRIFEPFFTTKPDGTGLGLSITKQIITMHEGTITLEPLPEGTSFQIILPGVDAEGVQGMTATILLVDDEKNARNNIGSYLESEGYEVLLAADLKTARKHLTAQEADIVLLDVQLPDGYGPDLTGRDSSTTIPPPHHYDHRSRQDRNGRGSHEKWSPRLHPETHKI